jgi:hypothetical protein
MDEDTRREKICNVIWFIVCAAVSSSWCIATAFELGATFDEPLYLERGLDYWHTGSHSGLLRVGTMPVPVDWQTLPIYLWERWRGQPFEVKTEAENLLKWARVGTLLFWWLLLFYAWKTARLLAGKWGARLAVAFLACEPSLLAHASLATTDIAVSACVIAFVYHFRAARELGWWRRVAWPGFWFGAATLAKASGMVFCSIAMVALEGERWVRAGFFDQIVSSDWRSRVRQLWPAFGAFRHDAFRIFIIGLFLTFLYCGSDWQAQASFVAWAARLPEGVGKNIAVWSADHLRIFPNAGEGIVRQVKHNVLGHGVYILGQTHPRALWYYFPLLLTIKLTIPILISFVFIVALRFRLLGNWAMITAAALLAFSVTWRVQIGIRLVLPLVVLAMTGLAAAIVLAWRQWQPSWKSKLLVSWSAGTIAWMACTVVAIWPNGLSFVNGFWGGSQNGYRLVSDSNYDWGQGLKELAHWQARQEVSTLDVWYFGTDPALNRLPMRQATLETLSAGPPEDLPRRLIGRYFAASTTLVYGTYLDQPALTALVRYLRACRPVAKTSTFLIYDLRNASNAPHHQARVSR